MRKVNTFLLVMAGGLLVLAGMLPGASAGAQEQDATAAAEQAAEPEVAPVTSEQEPQLDEVAGEFPEEIETTLFDLYLADKLEGAVLVDFTETWFEVGDPEEIIEQLPRVKNKEDLLRVFSGRIDDKREVPGVASIELDRYTFRLVINIDPEYLFAKKLELGNRIPDPDRTFAIEQALGLAVSGELSGDYDGSLNPRTLITLGKYWAEFDATVVKAGKNEITELSTNAVIGENYLLNVGLLQSDGPFLTTSAEFAGISAQTTAEVFLNQELLQGSRFEIFIPSRARVEFFRGQRLLSVQNLEFGLQEVDTSSFPQGSYDVDIIVTEETGEVTRQRKFFVKSGLLAVRDTPIYTAHLGVLRDENEIEGEPVFLLSSRWRAMEYLQVEGQLYGVDDRGVSSLEFLGLYKETLLGAGILASNEGDLAYSARLNFSYNNFGITASALDTIEGFEAPQQEDSDEEQATEDEPPFELLSSTVSDINASADFRYEDFVLRYTANRTETNDGDKRFSYGPRVEWTFFRSPSSIARFEASFFRTETGKEYSGLISYNYRFGNWNVDSSPRYQSINGRGDSALRTSLTYDNRQTSDRGTKATFRNEFRRTEEETKTSNIVVNAIEAEHTNSYVNASGFITDSRADDSDTTSVGLNVASGFILTEDAQISVTNALDREAVFVAEIDGDESDNYVELIMNGQLIDRLQVGTTTAVPLQPYRVYEVTIRPEEASDLVSYDAVTYSFSVFPGNIIKKTWGVAKVFIAIGRVVDSDGNPIALQRVKGVKEYSITEEDGSFQIEISGKEQMYIDSRSHNCKLELPKIGQPEYLIDLGDVICR